jgi:hypothetical protein
MCGRVIALIVQTDPLIQTNGHRMRLHCNCSCNAQGLPLIAAKLRRDCTRIALDSWQLCANCVAIALRSQLVVCAMLVAMSMAYIHERSRMFTSGQHDFVMLKVDKKADKQARQEAQQKKVACSNRTYNRRSKEFIEFLQEQELLPDRQKVFLLRFFYDERL